tara:strand:- start:1119 stop:1463 length:345 start_codon:yes stop_codon:yes gene_type:complete
MMFEYDKVEPVFPGNHIEGWQKTRKKQWKFIKNIIEEGGYSALRLSIPQIKKEYFLLESPNFDAEYSKWAYSEISAEYHPHQWEGGAVADVTIVLRSERSSLGEYLATLRQVRL